MRKTYISTDITEANKEDIKPNIIIDRKIEDGKTTYIVGQIASVDKYNNINKYLYGRKYDEIPESYNERYGTITTNNGLVLVYNKTKNSSNTNDAYIYDLFPYDFITPPAEENKYGSELNNETNIYKNLSKYYKTAFHTIIYDGKSIKPNISYGSGQYGTLDMDLPNTFDAYYSEEYIENLKKNKIEGSNFETIAKKHGLYDLSEYDYKKDIFIKAKPYIYISLDSSNFTLYDDSVLQLIPCGNGIYFVSGLEEYSKPFIKLTIKDIENQGNVEKQIIMFM